MKLTSFYLYSLYDKNLVKISGGTALGRAFFWPKYGVLLFPEDNIIDTPYTMTRVSDSFQIQISLLGYTFNKRHILI